MELPVNYDNLTPHMRKKVREQYVVNQYNLCYYCNETITDEPPISITSKKINWDLFPPNFCGAPIHLQHNHDTGMTEGAVHAYCNAVMWQYENR